MKKKKITLIILCACLAIVSVVYFAVIAPLISDGDGDDETEPPETVDGEGIYLGRICLYPVIEDTENLISIEIENEKGSFSFVKTWNENKGKYEMKIKGHENMSYDDLSYGYLLAYVCTPSSVDNNPIRDLTDEDMKQYGVTEDLCLATYKVTYKDENGEQKSHTVRLGEKAASSSVTYYVALEGRNSVYRMMDGVEKSILLSLEEYVSPKIFSKFNNDSQAVMQTESIFAAILDGSSISPIWQIVSDKKTETSATFKLNLPNKQAPANVNYVKKILGYLYCGFSGEATVCADVTDEARKEYGLSEDDKVCLISAKFSDDQEVTFAMSEPKDGYRYIVSDFYGEDYQIIVRIPEEKCEFLKSDDESLIKLAAADIYESGDFEYIEPNEEAGKSGFKSVSIKALIDGKMFEDKFNLSFENGTYLTATSDSGKYEFIDDKNAEEGSDTNQFRNFCFNILRFPKINRFNSNTFEEISEIRKNGNILLEVTIELGNGELLGYRYYDLESDPGFAMRETFSGTSDEGLGKGEIVFDVTEEHINTILSYLKKLINGEKVPIE